MSAGGILRGKAALITGSTQGIGLGVLKGACPCPSGMCKSMFRRPCQCAAASARGCNTSVAASRCRDVSKARGWVRIALRPGFTPSLSLAHAPVQRAGQPLWDSQGASQAYRHADSTLQLMTPASSVCHPDSSVLPPTPPLPGLPSPRPPPRPLPSTALAAAGCDVSMHGLPTDRPKIERLCADIQSQHGVRVAYSEADLLKPAAIRDMVKQTADSFGR